MAWYRRLFNFARSEKLSRDLDREFAHHIAERRDELIASGMNARDAESEARRKFGNPTAQKERTREIDILAWLDSAFSDIRYSVRALRRSPGFTIVAVLSLALGIGANTAIFSLVNAVLLRSLPVSHPEELVAITMGPGDFEVTNPIWEAVREQQDSTHLFAGAFATTTQRFDLTTGGEVRTADGEYVSGSYFSVLGVRPLAGRLFTRSDDVRGCRAIAVLSAPFFASEFGADPSTIGKSIELSGKQFEIVGVTDPAYTGMTVGAASQVFVPLCADAVISGSDANLTQRQRWWITMTARLKPGATIQEAQSRLKAMAPGVFAATLPANQRADVTSEFLKSTLSAEPQAAGLSDLRASYRTALITLMVVVAVVLLIACGNVANLLLARARARQREAAVRLAVGAGRGRLIRQLLTESLVLASLGTALGVLFALWGSRALVAMLSTPRSKVYLDLGLDWRMLIFTAFVAVATGLLFGIVPAWRSANVDPQQAMRGAGRGVTDEGRRFSLVKTLVVGQVALSLVLLIAAGLLLGSFERQTSINLGFEGDHVLTVNVDARRAGIAPDQRADYYRTLLDRLRTVPGVTSVSSVDIMPISGARWNGDAIVDGFTPKDRADGIVWFNAVSPVYFATLSIPMSSGRDFGANDTRDSPKVAIINESMQRHFFGGKSALGQFVQTRAGPDLGPKIQVVGVVKDSKYGYVTEPHSETIFLPASQQDNVRPNTVYALRTAGPPSAVIPLVRTQIASMSPLLAYRFNTLDNLVAVSLQRPRLLARLSLFFGALALALAIIGLYGTMSYSVERRRNDIGIRIALGAERRRVLSMVLGEAGRMVATGIVVGVAIAVGATRWVSALLYGVKPTDVPTFALAGAALAIVAIGASAIPAWRAARLDPMEALREE
ncbi:MAG TPA: ABC transporter permease [Gemmatimonadaceae bacterium]|jgi:predicted permease|nr:ABC transporter permease [Gemmatimonadaceae bacterium]